MLPSRSGCFRFRGAVVGISLGLAAGLFAVAKEPKPSPRSTDPSAPVPTEKSSGGIEDIPLAIGREAKVLVLPDYDLVGKLRSRYEVGVAKRTDQDHMDFQHLKMQTYDPEGKEDLFMDAAHSVLDLKARILTTKERTTIKRPDLEVSGDVVEINMATRLNHLTGNVKMLISDREHLMEPKPQ